MAQGLKKHVLRPKVSSPDSNILGQSPLFSILSSVISSNSPDLSVDICLCMHKHTVPCEFSVIIEKKQGVSGMPKHLDAHCPRKRSGQ
jgi:hypothetical protein